MSGPRRFSTATWILLALYVLAVAVRFVLRHILPYGYEPTEFWMSIHQARPPPRVDMDGVFDYHHGFEFYQRPAFYILMFPFASISFDAFRLANLLGSALLVPFACLLLRRRGAPVWIWAPIGVVLSVAPIFVVWGVLGYEDGWMTAAFAAGLLLDELGAPVAAAATFLLATWFKETAFFGLLLLFVWDLGIALKAREAAVWPRLVLPVRLTARAYALTVALVPLFTSVLKGLGSPGAPARSNASLQLIDQLLLTSLFLPLLVLGLLRERSRRLAALGLGYPAFFLVMHVAFHRSVDVWYFVLPNFLVLLGVGATIDAYRLHPLAFPRTQRRSSMPARLVAVALVVFFAATWAMPATAAKGRILEPVSGTASEPILTTYGRVLHEQGYDYRNALDRLPMGPSTTATYIDLFYPETISPWTDGHGTVVLGYTFHRGMDHARFVRWADEIENRTDGTLIMKWPYAFNEDIRATYHDCATFENQRFLVIDAHGCQGRAARLEADYDSFL